MFDVDVIVGVWAVAVDGWADEGLEEGVFDRLTRSAIDVLLLILANRVWVAVLTGVTTEALVKV